MRYLIEKLAIGVAIIIGIILVLILIAIWLFPLILAFYQDNWAIVFMYFIWWIPAAILTAIWKGVIEVILALIDHIS